MLRRSIESAEEEGDLFGDAVVLADRIEAVAPADEIYLSAAASLAVNQAEVHTTLVDAFALKGFSDPVPSTGSSTGTEHRGSPISTLSSLTCAASQSSVESRS